MNDVTCTSDLKTGDHFQVITVGVPREPMQFILDAVAAGHPKNAFARVSPLMREVLQEVFLGDALAVRQRRTSFLKKWLKRSLEFKSEEEATHAALPEHLKPILAKKRLLLWREILESRGCPDYKVIDEVMTGVPLTGWASQSGVFDTSVRPPDNSVEQLEGMARGLNMAVVSSLQSSEWQPIVDVAWSETLNEVERGWLGMEVCPDFNTQFFAKRSDSIDEVMACLSILLDEIATGRDLTGVLGRTFDLRAAYKQFGVDAEHARKLRIAVKKLGGGIGLEDDTTFFAESLFKLLGLDFAAEGSKAPPFSCEFRTLGLMVKTSEFLQGKVELGHTPERREELFGNTGVTIEIGQSDRFCPGMREDQLRRFRFDEKLIGALAVLQRHLKPSLNVVVSRDVNQTWCIFTDGAYEPDQEHAASIGGVLVHPLGKVVSFFGASLNRSLLDEFLSESKHPISELEIFPLVVAVRAWSHFLKDQLVVLDNDAARSAFIRADAGTRLGCALIED
eukprot:s3129_g2.t1